MVSFLLTNVAVLLLIRIFLTISVLTFPAILAQYYSPWTFTSSRPNDLIMVHVAFINRNAENFSVVPGWNFTDQCLKMHFKTDATVTRHI